MKLGSVFFLFAAATIISACYVAWYEVLLKRYRLPSHREKRWKILPRIVQNPEYYSQEGQRYQARALRHLGRMYLFFLCALVARCVGV